MPDLLRETFEAYVERAPRADGLRAAVDARVRRYRRRAWTTVGAATVATAAVVAGVAVVADRPATRGAPVVATLPPAPAGTTWYPKHGVEVAVPTAWLGGTVNCGIATTDAVVDNVGPVFTCLPTVPSHLDVATFGGSAGVEGYFVGQLEERDDTLGGVAVRRIIGKTYAGQYMEALVIPSRAYSVRVSADDPAVARRVLDTARILDVDSYGCVARRENLYAPPPARAEASREMVPGSFADVSVCRYVGGWAVRSRRVEGRDAEVIADVLNGLAPGFTTPSSHSRDDDDVTRGEAIVATFRYPSGPPVEVFVHVNGRRELGASNGAVKGKLSDELQNTLLPVTGWADAFPGNLY